MEIKEAINNLVKALEQQPMTAKLPAMEVLVDSIRCAKEWSTQDTPVPYMANSLGEVNAHDD